MKNTVVIVDDSELFRNMLKGIIEKFGFKVLLCNDGVEAIDCLVKNAHCVAAVFLDILMPQIDGISVLGHFRSNYPALPVFMMTGSEDPSDKRSAIGLGAAGFIQKPFIADSIYETVSEPLATLK